jgi:hypothetical protein
MAKPGARVIVLLENVRKLENNPNEHYLRGLYNDFLKRQCEKIAHLTHLDVNSVTSIDWLWDDGFHMDRQGYYELAQAVIKLIQAGRAPVPLPPSVPTPPSMPPVKIVSGHSWPVMSTGLFGRQRPKPKN